MKKHILLFALLLIGILNSCTTTDQGFGKLDIRDVMDEFVACKEESTEKNSCKQFTAKAICGQFGISDFIHPTKPGEFIDYDDIPESVSNSGKWQEMGNASVEGVIAKATDYVAQGIPVIGISTSSSYQHVTILLQGEGAVSTSCGGKVPLCASFFPTKPENSFVDKGLNYAYGKPDEVVLWARN